MCRFENQIVLITGGTSGIGREAAVLFAKEKAVVIVCGRREKEGLETTRLIEKTGGSAVFVPCDISIEREAESLITQIIKTYGRLDIAVNNAGISPKRSPLTELSEEVIDRVLSVNVKGVLFCMKYELREMTKRKSGVIVNVASALGLKAMSLGHTIYTASKHAVVGITKSAALETAGNGIRINAVCPGGVDTEIHQMNAGTSAGKKALSEMHPMNRLADPQEIAKVILFLCSSDASFITGTAIPVDGGVMAG